MTTNQPLQAGNNRSSTMTGGHNEQQQPSLSSPSSSPSSTNIQSIIQQHTKVVIDRALVHLYMASRLPFMWTDNDDTAQLLLLQLFQCFLKDFSSPNQNNNNNQNNYNISINTKISTDNPKNNLLIGGVTLLDVLDQLENDLARPPSALELSDRIRLQIENLHQNGPAQPLIIYFKNSNCMLLIQFVKNRQSHIVRARLSVIPLYPSIESFSNITTKLRHTVPDPSYISQDASQLTLAFLSYLVQLRDVPEPIPISFELKKHIQILRDKNRKNHGRHHHHRQQPPQKNDTTITHYNKYGENEAKIGLVTSALSEWLIPSMSNGGVQLDSHAVTLVKSVRPEIISPLPHQVELEESACGEDLGGNDDDDRISKDSVPWRRSPLWIGIKSIIHLLFLENGSFESEEEVEKEEGSCSQSNPNNIVYKSMMLCFMSFVAEHVVSLDPNFFQVTAKLAKRSEKLMNDSNEELYEHAINYASRVSESLSSRFNKDWNQFVERCNWYGNVDSICQGFNDSQDFTTVFDFTEIKDSAREQIQQLLTKPVTPKQPAAAPSTQKPAAASTSSSANQRRKPRQRKQQNESSSGASYSSVPTKVPSNMADQRADRILREVYDRMADLCDCQDWLLRTVVLNDLEFLINTLWLKRPELISVSSSSSDIYGLLKNYIKVASQHYERDPALYSRIALFSFTLVATLDFVVGYRCQDPQLYTSIPIFINVDVLSHVMVAYEWETNQLHDLEKYFLLRKCKQSNGDHSIFGVGEYGLALPWAKKHLTNDLLKRRQDDNRRALEKEEDFRNLQKQLRHEIQGLEAKHKLDPQKSLQDKIKKARDQKITPFERYLPKNDDQANIVIFENFLTRYSDFRIIRDCFAILAEFCSGGKDTKLPKKMVDFWISKQGWNNELPLVLLRSQYARKYRNDKQLVVLNTTEKEIVADSKRHPSKITFGADEGVPEISNWLHIKKKFIFKLPIPPSSSSSSNKPNHHRNKNELKKKIEKDQKEKLNKQMVNGLVSAEINPLQWIIDNDIIDENQVLATQCKAPLGMRPYDYIKFGQLRSGGGFLHVRNLLRYLSEDGNDLNSLAFLVLVQQTLFKAGPAQTSTMSHNSIPSTPIRPWKESWGDDQVIQLLGVTISRLLEESRMNWDGHNLLLAIIQLVSYILNNSKQSQTNQSTLILLLLQCRMIAKEWVETLKQLTDQSLRSANHSSEVLEMYRRKLVYACTAIVLTYDFQLYNLPDSRIDPLVNQQDNQFTGIVDLVGALITIHNNTFYNERLGKKLSNELEEQEQFDYLMTKVDIIAHHRSKQVHKTVDSNSILLSKIILQYWYEGGNNDQTSLQLFNVWKRFMTSDEWECDYNNGLTKIKINIATGSLLINGESIKRLPIEIESHYLFKRLFDTSIFEVINISKNRWRTIRKYSGKSYEFFIREGQQLFGDDDQHSIGVCEIHENGDQFYLIDHQHFDFLPLVLEDEYSHWLDAKKQMIEFRTTKFSMFNQQPIKYIGDLGRGTIKRTDNNKLLVKVDGDLKEDIEQLFKLENEDHIHVYEISQEDSEKSYNVHLYQYRLDFKVNCKLGVIESVQYSGYRISENQNIGTLIGLETQLILQHSTADKTKVIIPNAKIGIKSEFERFGCVEEEDDDDQYNEQDESFPPQRERDSIEDFSYINGLSQQLLTQPFTLEVSERRRKRINNLDDEIVKELDEDEFEEIDPSSSENEDDIDNDNENDDDEDAQSSTSFSSSSSSSSSNSVERSRYFNISDTDVGALQYPSYFIYDLDKQTRLVKASDSTAHLHLAYAHLMTSSAFPDPFTGLTGLECAILQLQSFRNNVQYTDQQLSILKRIKDVAPRRYAIPNHSGPGHTVLQHVDFKHPQLSHPVTQDVIALVVDDIVKGNDSIKFLWPSKPTSINPIVPDTRLSEDEQQEEGDNKDETEEKPLSFEEEEKEWKFELIESLELNQASYYRNRHLFSPHILPSQDVLDRIKVSFETIALTMPSQYANYSARVTRIVDHPNLHIDSLDHSLSPLATLEKSDFLNMHGPEFVKEFDDIISFTGSLDQEKKDTVFSKYWTSLYYMATQANKDKMLREKFKYTLTYLQIYFHMENLFLDQFFYLVLQQRVQLVEPPSPTYSPPRQEMGSSAIIPQLIWTNPKETFSRFKLTEYITEQLKTHHSSVPQNEAQRIYDAILVQHSWENDPSSPDIIVAPVEVVGFNPPNIHSLYLPDTLRFNNWLSETIKIWASNSKLKKFLALVSRILNLNPNQPNQKSNQIPIFYKDQDKPNVIEFESIECEELQHRMNWDSDILDVRDLKVRKWFKIWSNGYDKVIETYFSECLKDYQDKNKTNSIYLDQFFNQKENSMIEMKRLFYQDLNESKESLIEKFNVPLKKPLGQESLEKKLAKIQKRVEDQSKEIWKLIEEYYLGSTDTADKMYLAAGCWRKCVPKIVYGDFINHYTVHHLSQNDQYAAGMNSFLNQSKNSKEKTIPEEIYKLIGVHILLQTYLQKIARCREASTDEDLVQELSHNRTTRTWSLEEYPSWLVFELEQSIWIRDIQADIAIKLMSADQNECIQLQMGEGKTSVILPIMCLAMSNKKSIARVNVLPSLLQTSVHDLQMRLGSAILNRPIYLYPFKREMGSLITNEHIEKIMSNLEQCHKRQGIILCTPEHRLSFALYWKLNFDRLTSMEGVLRYWDEHIFDIMDECDEILSHRYQLLYPTGSKIPLDGGSDRWKVIQEVLSELKNLDFRAIDKKKIEFRSNNSQQYPTIVVYDFDEGRKLMHQLMKRMMRTLPFNASKEKLGVLEAFCWIDADIKEEVHVRHQRIIKDMTNDESILNRIYIYRGLFSNDVLLHALQKIWSNHYGIRSSASSSMSSQQNGDSSTLLAVPYRAKDTPSETSEFGHPEFAMILTHISYYNQGLTFKQFKKALYRLLTFHKTQASDIYRTWTDYDQTIEPKYRDIKCVVRSDISLIRHLHTLFRYNCRVINFWLNELVFPFETKQYPSKLFANPWDLVNPKDERKQYISCGFSGTNDTKCLYPLTIQQSEMNQLKYTNVQVLNYILGQNDQQNQVSILKLGEDITQKMTTKPNNNNNNSFTNVLIDAGALMIGQTNEQVARNWLAKTPQSKIDGALFFENDKLTSIDRDGKKFLFSQSPFSERLDRVIVYLDDYHTRGVDIKLPTHSHGLVTIGAKMTKEKLLQACMRMRKLGKGHTVSFVIPEQLNVSPRVVDILHWTINNTIETNVAAFGHWGHQGMLHARLQSAMQLVKHGKAFTRLSSLPEVTRLESMYCGQHKEYLASKVIENQASSMTYRFVQDINSDGTIPHETKEYEKGQYYQFLKEIAQRSKQLVNDVKIYSSPVDEEQEREFEIEIELESVQQPPGVRKACPANIQTQLLMDLVTGKKTLDVHSRFYKDFIFEVKEMYRNTSLFNLVESLDGSSSHSLTSATTPFSLNIKVTKDFINAVEKSTSFNFDKIQYDDEFQRPLNYCLVLWNVSDDRDKEPFIVLVSMAEANCLMGEINKLVNVHQTNDQHHRNVDQEIIYGSLHQTIPHGSLMRKNEEYFTTLHTPLPTTARLELLNPLLVQLNLLNGSRYFADQSAVRKFLGIVRLDTKEAMSKLIDHSIVDQLGFIGKTKQSLLATKPANITDEQWSQVVKTKQSTKFQVCPIEFLIKNLQLHRIYSTNYSDLELILKH
ncbi:hypothetical protein DFA_00068 [Cavenderia fasciculata]|uniref:ubiquitinyl hydrolase 1 n=1 Tax=Cavenderia fasciculata TaxID=261658 RepID=F4PXI1_CACFS|nr:uncharacterized protein DFA_00068 [Cavenderia fasciculata]EGG19491.1 hypothetical protein DFA_00068 [Cavenderia fasciculata]|eukprot:XP_004357785.1 hypothetical protein DFA_00068 [Cavenderia fasciculata]